MEKGRGREASAGDAFGDPGAIDFREEAADLVPTGPLAGLTGFADQHDEKIEAMASGIDQAMGAGTSGVAEGDQKLEKNGGGVSLGVRGESSCRRPRDAIEGGFAEYRVCGSLVWWQRWLRRRILPRCWIWLGLGRRRMGH